jgi:cytochrome c oxidase subunit 2
LPGSRQSANKQASVRIRRPWRFALSRIGALLLMFGGHALAAGEEKLYAPCVACHGNRGQGNASLNAPALAGLDAAYVERQLRNFRSGIRGSHKSDTFGAQMRATAATLPDDAAFKQVSAWISALPKTVVEKPATGNLRNGNNLYQGKCSACHGVRAEGIPALRAPRLVGLDAAYMKRQFAHFRDSVRGTDPKDLPGRQMAMMSKTIPTERDLDDVIAFIHQQGRAK